MPPSDMSDGPAFTDLRARAGLAVIPIGQGVIGQGVIGKGVIIEGGQRRRLLRGEAAARILPRLFPLMDGSHERTEVRAALGLTDQQLDQALRPLLADGLLISAPARTASHSGPGFAEPASFFDRSAEQYGGQPNADDIIAGLAMAQVVLAGRTEPASLAAADLKESGAGHVRVAAEPAAVARILRDHARSEGRRLVVYFEDAAQQDEAAPDTLASLVEICAAADVPLLRCALGDTVLTVGPLFVSGYTACVECLRRGEQLEIDSVDSVDSSPADAVSAGWSEAAIGILAGMAVSETLAFLTGAACGIRRRLIRLTLPDWSTEWFDVVPDRDCRSCWGGQPPSDASYLTEICDWHAELPPREVTAVATRTSAEVERLTTLPMRRTTFPTVPRRPRLRPQPQPQPQPRHTGTRSTATIAYELGAIMNRIAGYRDDAGPTGRPAPARRWTPSAGGLASVEVFAITRPGVFDLPGTVFTYDDIADQILAVRADEIGLDAVLRGTGLDPSAIDAVLVLTGATGRLAEKYESFAWRLAHLDAGCALTQLALVAAEHEADVQLAAGWDPQLGELLTLETDRQVITAVVGIRFGREVVSCP